MKNMLIKYFQYINTYYIILSYENTSQLILWLDINFFLFCKLIKGFFQQIHLENNM